MRTIPLTTEPVPTTPDPAECGFITWARTLADALTAAVDAASWRAWTRSTDGTGPDGIRIGRVGILLDPRTLVVVTHVDHVRAGREAFTVAVDGQRAPYRLGWGEAPMGVDPIVRAVVHTRWGWRPDECQSAGCTQPGTTVVLPGRWSMCHGCAWRHLSPTPLAHAS